MYGLSLLKSVAVAMLILANAFFVAAEFVLVSIRRTRVEQLVEARVPGARAVRRLQDDLDDLLPAVQLGVTLCSLALGWVGQPLVAAYLAPLFLALPHSRIYAHVASAILAFCLITYFEVVIGELVPKSLALRRAEGMAVAIAPPMLAFMAMVRPAVHLLRVSAAAVLRVFGVPMSELASVHSAEELKLIATSARRMGLMPAFQETLVHRSLEIDELLIREIMTPRQSIFCLPSNMPLEEATARVVARSFSRIPIYDETRGPEHIVGIVYAKDLARLMYFRSVSRMVVPAVEIRLKQIMRDVLVVPETKTVLDLITDFKERRRQIAIAVDEFGSVVGLVTAEDAVEQLTGELEDAFDNPVRFILSTVGGAMIMDGNVNLRDLETQMNWSLPREGGVETLAGFILVQLGHVPTTGESVEYDGRRMTVVEMDARRIAKIRVEAIEEPADSDDEYAPAT
jgi:CBS domain containing-hemolysin-like protein